MRTYLDHWRLRHGPFENTCSPQYFVNGKQHKEALERMMYIVRDRNMGFGLLTGEIGCGKTMVSRVLKDQLPKNEFETILLPNTPMEFGDVMCEVMTQMQSGFGRRPAETTPRYARETGYEMQCKFMENLETKVIRPKKHMVLILDEAQQMVKDTLVQLKGLTNLAERDQSYLTVLLFGQAELYYQIHELPQIDQRIGLRYHLRPLSEKETGNYVDGRMKAAGYTGPSIFSQATKDALFLETQGFPREINRICKLALDRAYAKREFRIGEDSIKTIVDDVFRQNALAV